jgi:molybdopterin synthase catalytic subunit
MRPPAPGTAGDGTWVGLTDEPLPTADAAAWAVRPGCGAVVTFAGTVRDHADGRPGVSQLEYEAYEEQVTPRLAAIADEARATWDGLGGIALLHRTGVLEVGETSVVVAVSAPHRGDAFEAARYCIDELKRRVPIWKRETWDGGEAWGLDAHDLDGHHVAAPDGPVPAGGAGVATP